MCIPGVLPLMMMAGGKGGLGNLALPAMFGASGLAANLLTKHNTPPPAAMQPPTAAPVTPQASAPQVVPTQPGSLQDAIASALSGKGPQVINTKLG